MTEAARAAGVLAGDMPGGGVNPAWAPTSPTAPVGLAVSAYIHDYTTRERVNR